MPRVSCDSCLHPPTTRVIAQNSQSLTWLWKNDWYNRWGTVSWSTIHEWFWLGSFASTKRISSLNPHILSITVKYGAQIIEDSGLLELYSFPIYWRGFCRGVFWCNAVLVETQTLIILIGLGEGKKGGAKMIQKTVSLSERSPNRKTFRSWQKVKFKFSSIERCWIKLMLIQRDWCAT